MKIFQVDAFTAEPFRGNPAAVCLLDSPADEGWMQALAAEMNLSETAFLHRRDGSGAGGPGGESAAFDLRWFTPVTEVDLCGHATLASAHVLWETGETPPDRRLEFHTRSGRLGAERGPDGAIWLDFPAEPAEEVTGDDVGAVRLALGRALGAQPVWVGRNRFDYLVELADEDTVRGLEPDLALVRELPVRGVVVTARAAPEAGCDFVSRFFGPAVGIDEDPVTGSAHCGLGPYWSERLDRTELLGYQASRRGGYVSVRVDGKRVRLGGRAVTVVRGEVLAGGHG